MKSLFPFFRRPALALACAALFTSGFPLSAQEPAAAAPDAPPAASVAPAATAPVAAPAPVVPVAPALPAMPPVERESGRRFRDLVQFGRDVHVAADEITESVVAISGSVRAEGEVRRAVVAIAGDATTLAPVGEDVVAILGNATAAARVRHGVVAILGNATVEGPVGQDVVAILGNVNLGPNASVQGDVVSIGGMVNRAPGSVIRGDVQSISLGVMPDFGQYLSWVRQCLLYARPLAFGEGVNWAWGVAAVFFLFYLTLALTAGKSMEKCLTTLRERPGRTLLATLITLILTPLVFALVIATGLGLFVAPLLILGLLGAGLFGRAVLLAWIGRGLTRPFGGGPGTSLLLSVALGGVLVALLYTVPVAGFLLWKFLGAFGFGVVVYTIVLGMKRDRPAEAAAGAARTWPAPLVLPSPSGHAFTAPPPPVASGLASAFTAEPPPAISLAPAAADLPSQPAFTAAPPLPSATTWPRAGFWRRFVALAVDALLIGILVGPLTEGVMVLPGLALYAACLWKARGTTIGGIIFGLKVVRLDERPVDWTTAIVRALACFISLGVVFLGFIWVAFDSEKQSWHDKIAGTVVVRPPRGMSLI
jgi:uncharacterized RDD family membrane protein YckC